MFEVTKLPAVVSNINVRAENHGDESKLAVDISLIFTTSHAILKQLDETLPASLYKRGDSGQPLLDGISEDAATEIRFPQIEKFPWDYKGAGYECLLDPDDLFEGNDVALDECAVNSFVVEPQDGGTVKMKVRVQAHPSEPQVGRISGFMKQTVLVTLTPPQAPAQGDIDDEHQEAA